MIKSEAKLREKFYNEHRMDGGKPHSRKKLKAMFYEQKKKNEGVRASSNVQRSSARKVTRVLDLIRGKNINQAIAIIKFTPKRAARLIEKVLLSAKANAENTRNMDAENLFVKRAYAEQGPTIARVRPMSMGRVGRIRKRTCSTFIILDEKKATVAKVVNDETSAKAKKATKPNTTAKKAKATPKAKKAQA
jgi:large subunit ribosomal protein L22